MDILNNDFVSTEYIDRITNRALAYLNSGFPVHLQGPSGTGKTTLALHLAKRLGRQVMLIHGDDDLDSEDMVGGSHGYRRRLLKDNFVHSVLKQDESWERHWVDGRLTSACKNGMTLVYDEFTRSRPETNNILLSVLEEGLLQLPSRMGSENHIPVHADFHVIFTSNPEEYAGVYKSQDALRDRMASIVLHRMDLQTEIMIVCRKSGLDEQQAAKIVSIVHSFANNIGIGVSVRRSIMVAKVTKNLGIPLNGSTFRDICLDLLGSEFNRKNGCPIQNDIMMRGLDDIIKRVLSTTERR